MQRAGADLRWAIGWEQRQGQSTAAHPENVDRKSKGRGSVPRDMLQSLVYGDGSSCSTTNEVK